MSGLQLEEQLPCPQRSLLCGLCSSSSDIEYQLQLSKTIIFNSWKHLPYHIFHKVVPNIQADCNSNANALTFLCKDCYEDTIALSNLNFALEDIKGKILGVVKTVTTRVFEQQENKTSKAKNKSVCTFTNSQSSENVSSSSKRLRIEESLPSSSVCNEIIVPDLLLGYNEEDGTLEALNSSSINIDCVDHQKPEKSEIVHQNQKIFHCDICSKNFSDKSAFCLHHKEHQKKEYQCSECFLVYKYESVYKRHLKTHSGSNSKSGIISVPLTKRQRYRMSHFTTKTANNEGEPTVEFVCTVCKKDFESHNELQCHTNVCKKSNNVENFEDKEIRLNRKSFEESTVTKPPELCFICQVCGISFSTEELLYDHQAENHVVRSRGPFYCESCHTDLPDAHGMWLHRRKNKCRCSFCGNFYPTNCDLTIHFRTDHFGNPVCKLTPENIVKAEGVEENPTKAYWSYSNAKSKSKEKSLQDSCHRTTNTGVQEDKTFLGTEMVHESEMIQWPSETDYKIDITYHNDFQ